ncbi:MAG: FAD-binding oxidoreductase [Planctomycetota bacterium JB042]
MPPLDALRSIVGDAHVLSTAGETFAYECDGLTHLRSRPVAVVLPASTDEVARVARVLHDAGVPYVARGAGTGLSGGALCPEGGVVVETARMKRVLSVDAGNRIAVVECGVTNAAVSAAAAPHGLFYAPDPSSQIACTIGGNVAENSGGPHCFKYGATARHVRGLTAVLPDGEVIRVGAAHGDAPGYDLVGLLVGSEGTCAIVTEATLLLTPRPERVETLLAAFESVEVACEAVRRIIGAGIEPSALEILDRLTIEAVEASVFAAGYPKDAGAVLLLEFDGSAVATDEAAGRGEALCRELSALSLERARDEEQRLKLWRGRKGAFGAMGRLAPDLYVQDAVVPRSRLPEVLAAVIEIGRRYEIRLSNVFHAGDGNLHPNVSYDRRDADETRRVVEAGREILRVCVEAGGSLSGEHGIGVEKRDYMTFVFSEDDLAKMRAVRDAFNPTSLLNPHKVLPTTRSCVEAKAGMLELAEEAP